MRRGKAKIRVASIEATCSYCAFLIPEPTTGSQYWTLEEVEALQGRRVRCLGCGTANSVRLAQTVRVR